MGVNNDGHEADDDQEFDDEEHSSEEDSEDQDSSDDTEDDGADEDDADDEDDEESNDDESEDSDDSDDEDGESSDKDKDGKESEDDDKPPVHQDNAANAARRIEAKKAKQNGSLSKADQKFAEQFERMTGESIDDYRNRVQSHKEEKMDVELDKFFSDEKNKDFKDDEAKIRKWWKDPSRSHLPIKTVALEVAGDRLLKIGAKRGRQADKEARRTRNSGHPVHAKQQGGSLLSKSPEEREQEIIAVKSGK